MQKSLYHLEAKSWYGRVTYYFGGTTLCWLGAVEEIHIW